MAVLGDVEVLEDGFEVNTVVLDSCAIFVEDHLHFSVISTTCKVLATGKKSVVGGDGGDTSGWVLVDSSDGESFVDVGDEINVTEETLWVGRLVLLGKSLELVVSQVEVHGGEDGFELVASNAALSELIKISEEFFDSHALHDDHGLDALLNIGGIV